MLARRLLELRNTDASQIDNIVAALTEKLYTHGYKISRKEARDDLKLPVEYADKSTEKAMVALRDVYVSEGHMDEPFLLGNEAQAALAGRALQAGQSVTRNMSLLGVAVDSDVGESAFLMEKTLTLTNPGMPPGAIQTTLQEVNQWKDTWY